MIEKEKKVCPIPGIGYCMQKSCSWWCGFAKECSIPLLAEMFADSEVFRNVFEQPKNYSEMEKPQEDKPAKKLHKKKESRGCCEVANDGCLCADCVKGIYDSSSKSQCCDKKGRNVCWSEDGNCCKIKECPDFEKKEI